ncbi:MAG TPA: NUDIX hydrolase, partial [Solirubrobacterales bacterium]
FANERVWLFLATELYDSPQRQTTDERIEVVEFPLTEIDTAIERCEDAKSLIGLLMLKDLI